MPEVPITTQINIGPSQTGDGNVQHVHLAPVEPLAALASLPEPPTEFVGRTGEHRRLRGHLDPGAPRAAEDTAPVVVSAVSGMGGVGKTTLTVIAARGAVGEGWFTGGVLFTDLRGYGSDPMMPEEALDGLLRDLGVGEPEIERRPTRQEKERLYRSSLARLQGPVLIIADNASRAAQVRSLVPGESRHRLVVTSRNRLAELGARLIDLDVLEPEESAQLIVEALGTAWPDDPRLRAGSLDRAALGRLADACGHLPLALQIAAARLKADRGLSIAVAADRLAAGGARLGRLRDGERAVRAVFAMSYHALEPRSQQLFRQLGVLPGREAHEVALVELADTEDFDELHDLLHPLLDAHLIARSGTHRRWRMHDLLHEYAAELADAEDFRHERRAARCRLLEHYAAALREADALLHGPKDPQLARARANSADWLDAERLHLITATGWTDDEACAERALIVATLLDGHMLARHDHHARATVAASAAAAAHRTGRAADEAGALQVLGIELLHDRRADEAITAHRQALRIRQLMAASSMLSLGQALGMARTRPAAGESVGARRNGEALAPLEQALAIYREYEDIAGQALALRALGSARQGVGDLAGSESLLEEAGSLFGRLGDLSEQSVVAQQLSSVRIGRRDFEAAATTGREAVRLSRVVGAPGPLAVALLTAAQAEQFRRRWTEALGLLDEALPLLRATRDIREAATWLVRASVLRQLGRTEEADASEAQCHMVGEDRVDARQGADRP